MPTQQNSSAGSVVEWLKRHWFLITALVAMSAAWGEQRYQVKTLENEMEKQVQVNAKVQEMAEQSARVDERTRAIQKSQERQEHLLQELIKKLGQ